MVRPIFFAVIFAMVAMYSGATDAKGTDDLPAVSDLLPISPEKCTNAHEEPIAPGSFPCPKSCWDLEGKWCNGVFLYDNECQCMSGYVRNLNDDCVLPEECEQE